MMQDVVAQSATRVALLARKGVACDRLQAALEQAGAHIVLVADPAHTDVDGVRQVGAQAILIALEPAVEDALDHYDALLADPAITIIFDEAELAAQRQGWDAARWTRHLAAKLNRHERVLPPGAELDSDMSSSGSNDDFHWDAPKLFERPESLLNLPGFAIDEAMVAIGAIPLDVPDSGRRYDDPDAAFEPQGDNGVNDRFHQELAELQVRTAAIDLPGPAPASRDNASDGGAVTVLAGIGGPDAVRQFLAAVPAGFPKPILVQQRLDGGQHEKLVRQMQRAATLPVCLAEVGQPMQAGHIYILPAGVIPEPQDGVLRFGQGAEGLPAFLHLPPGDSAVLMLSGSDPGMVDAAMTHAWGGAVVAGQSPEGCFDGAAATALVGRGASAATPADLAKRLAMRWLSLKD